uniref:NADPH-dependent glutamate synthase beta chain n=1 Tax=Candidatus Kentrum sp. TUN TaxID=2126343 RepID=A0A450ZDE7_9GAMM|nr:MAG: NADPH-dependent glutamate synthase beta chain [Candidatus Kentron sp. TUN]VFK54577.1 MAG: NADPH-dependent glutamate synthase beta chain [Candidatus Kentron sp. TUN]VFK57601.1 MAG: NADPH-dependent glutamate synthase beta chain [Candidatus Kentron sp. TUN]
MRHHASKIRGRSLASDKEELNMNKKWHDITRPPNLAHEQFSGPQRTQYPVYADLLPPCNHACPAGENIQAWLALVQQGQFKEAWDLIMEENPLPAVHGRVCYHPCEKKCNRTRLDATVNVHAIERFLGDQAVRNSWRVNISAEPSGKRVLVVGAGPSGLSAAYHLKRMGHEVEIHEAGPIAGGMMHFGIPKYRLPRQILDMEIKRIEDMGVKIILNRKVDDLLAEKEAGEFDVVFLAIGAHLSKRTEIPQQDAGKIMDAVSFLKSVENEEDLKLGRRVAIYGGGNTAMDAARTAKRLGVEEALIIYRRDREHMPAHAFEAEEAEEEGVKIHWLRTIKEIDRSTFKVEIMRIDEKGRPQPTGEFETLEADSLILALGQEIDTSFLKNVPGLEFQEDGTLIVDNGLMTGYAGLFAGGDMVPSQRTVTVSVGHGKKAARHIDAWLRGDTYVKPQDHEIASFDKLHVWYFTDSAQRFEGHIDLKNRQTSFDEVVDGLQRQDVLYEARRCLSCGNCFECDGCYGACPDNAVTRRSDEKVAEIKAETSKHRRYEYDYARCSGCAVCFEQCPCHAIELVPEEAETDSKPV